MLGEREAPSLLDKKLYMTERYLELHTPNSGASERQARIRSSKDTY